MTTEREYCRIGNHLIYKILTPNMKATELKQKYRNEWDYVYNEE